MSHPTNDETVLWLIRHPEPDKPCAAFATVHSMFRFTRKGSTKHSASRFGYPNNNSIPSTSPRQRCVETASCIAAGRSCAFEPVDALRELNFGDLEGRSYNEIAECYPELHHDWMEHPTEVHFPTVTASEKWRIV